jgi:hypothetical protein
MVIRPYLNGRDLAQRPRGLWIIDFALMTLQEAEGFPFALQLVRDRVYPERQSNLRAAYRNFWWRFGEARRGLRDAVALLPRFVATSYVASHRVFRLVDRVVAPDDTIVVVACDSVALVAILSSHIHATWAAAAGGKLGVGNDQRWNKSLCFEPFPFPVLNRLESGHWVGTMARIDQHRESALASDDRVTITKIYNVVEKLRSDTPLTPAERTIHELAACGILRDLHDELDRLVAEAYGWPWPMEKEEILERLVALHDERIEEEKRGLIRWLRPDYQIPRFAPEQAAATLALDETPAAKPKRGKKAKVGEAPTAPQAKMPWPATVVEQITAITAALAQRPQSAGELSAAFAGASSALVARHLETLALMGEIALAADGRYHPVRRAA